MKKVKNIISTVFVLFLFFSCAEENVDSTLDLNLYNENRQEVAAGVMIDNSTRLGPVIDASSGACIPQIDDCELDCTTYSFTDRRFRLRQKGDRPACDYMMASYTITICFDPYAPLWTLYLYNLKVWPDCDRCPSFCAWFQMLPDEEKGVAIEEWTYDVSKIIELVEADRIMKQNPVLPTCPEVFLVANYIRKICYSRCLELREEGPHVFDQDCGVVCCVRTRRACKSNYPNGPIYFFQPTFSVQGEDCSPSEYDCPPNSIRIRSCDSECKAPGPEYEVIYEDISLP